VGSKRGGPGADAIAIPNSLHRRRRLYCRRDRASPKMPSSSTTCPAGVRTVRPGVMAPCAKPAPAWRPQSAGSTSRRYPSATSRPGTVPCCATASSSSDIRLPGTNSERTMRAPSGPRSIDRGLAIRSSSRAAMRSRRSRSDRSNAESSARTASRSSIVPSSRSKASERRPRPSE
jgi:hypothetical protein